MGDRVGNAGVLRCAVVGEVDLTVSRNSNVFEQCVALDGTVDVGFAFLVEVDHLSVATTFEVEDAVVIPTVFVVTDEETLRISRKGGLTRTGETEEDCGVLAFEVRVGRAVHSCDAAEGKIVVHHREHTLLHFAAVPSVEDHLFLGGDVEGNASFGVQTEFLVVFNLRLRSVVNHEVGFEVFELFSRGLDEHIGHEVSLPSNFHDEANSETRVLVGAAESIDNEETLVREFLLGKILHNSPSRFRHGVVVVLVTFGGPPNGVLGVLVHNDELILGRTAGVDTRLHVHSAEFGHLTLFVSFEGFLGFFFEELFVRRIVYDFGSTRDAVLCEI